MSAVMSAFREQSGHGAILAIPNDPKLAFARQTFCAAQDWPFGYDILLG